MKDEIARLIRPVTREVCDEAFQGHPARVVVVSRLYDTDIRDLWDALTNA